MRKTVLAEKSSEELMLLYQQDSPEDAYEAFAVLYERFHKKVYSFLLSKCKSSADADDLLQKVFLKMHECRHLYKNKYKVEQWIFVIARTTTLDFFRTNTRYKNRLEKYSPLQQEEFDSDQLNTLNEDQREILEMKFIDEISYREMSKLLNKPETALRKMVSRMMGSLRKGEA